MNLAYIYIYVLYFILLFYFIFYFWVEMILHYFGGSVDDMLSFWGVDLM